MHFRSLTFPINRYYVLSLILLAIHLVFACRKEDSETPSNKLTPYSLKIPGNFPPMVIPGDNPLSEEGVALGKKLFYDPVLHKDQAKSCASCHQQSLSFSSPVAVLPHINLGYDDVFLWKGDVKGSLEDIMLFEVRDFFKTDLSRINADAEYKKMFKKVFGVDEIGYKEIAYALAQFERTVISSNSKFDRFMRKEENLSEPEMRGYNLFYSETADCFHCHGSVLFKDNLFHNNGLDNTFEGENAGRFLVTNDSSDLGKFKTPTLRNIELTAPYMHDGRYKTLEEVIEFYNSRVNFTRHTDPLMKHSGGIQLTEEQKKDLVAFLKTLTDTSFIYNKNFKKF